jgi:hypothetical protein
MKKLLLSLLVAILFAPFAQAQEWEYLPNTDDFEITGTFEFKGQHYVYNEFSLWYFDEVMDEWVYATDDLLNLDFEYYPEISAVFHDEATIIIVLNYFMIFTSHDGKNWTKRQNLNLVKNGIDIQLCGYLNGNLLGLSNPGTEEVAIFKSQDFGKNFEKISSIKLDRNPYPPYKVVFQDNDQILFTESFAYENIYKINSDFSSKKIPLPNGNNWTYLTKVHAQGNKILVPYFSSAEYYNGTDWESKVLKDTTDNYYPSYGFIVGDNIYYISEEFLKNERISKYDINFNLIERYDLPENIDGKNILSFIKNNDEFTLISGSKHQLRTKDFNTFQFFHRRLSSNNEVELVSQGMDLFINNSDGIYRTSDGDLFKKIIPDTTAEPSDYLNDNLFAIGKEKLLYYPGSYRAYFISNNNGENWKEHYTSESIRQYHKENRFYQANNRYFFFYGSSKDTFFRLDVENQQVEPTNLDFQVSEHYSIKFYGEQETIFCSIHDYLYKSIDGGITWFLEKESGQTLKQASKRLFKVLINGNETKIFEWKNYKFNEIIAGNTYEMTSQNPTRNIVEYKNGLAYISMKGMYYLEDGSIKWEKQSTSGFNRDYIVKKLVPTRFGLAVANKYRGAWFLKEQVVNVITNEIESLTVYPNPNKGAGTLSLENNFNGSLKIIGMDGKEYFSKEIEGSNFDFEMVNSIPGNYLLILTDQKGIVQFKGKLLVY